MFRLHNAAISKFILEPPQDLQAAIALSGRAMLNALRKFFILEHFYSTKCNEIIHRPVENHLLGLIGPNPVVVTRACSATHPEKY